jgi:hypothetical protein
VRWLARRNGRWGQPTRLNSGPGIRSHARPQIAGAAIEPAATRSPPASARSSRPARPAGSRPGQVARCSNRRSNRRSSRPAANPGPGETIGKQGQSAPLADRLAYQQVNRAAVAAGDLVSEVPAIRPIPRREVRPGFLLFRGRICLRPLSGSNSCGPQRRVAPGIRAHPTACPSDGDSTGRRNRRAITGHLVSRIPAAGPIGTVTAATGLLVLWS